MQIPAPIHNTAIRARMLCRYYLDGMRGNMSGAVLFTFGLFFLVGLGLGLM